MTTIEVTQEHIDAAIAWDNDPDTKASDRAECCVIGQALTAHGFKGVACGTKVITVTDKDGKIRRAETPEEVKYAMKTFDSELYDELKPFIFQIQFDNEKD